MKEERNINNGERGITMRFGCCASVRLYDEVAEAGYDYIEIPGGELAELSDEEYEKIRRKIECGPIPCIAVNSYAKSEPKMVGDGFSEEKTGDYAELIMSRASRLGVKTVGIGAPGIRRLPEGYDKNTALEQAKKFLRITSGVAEKYGITVLFEQVHKYICDFGTDVDEVYSIVDELAIPNLKMVFDFYHLKPTGESNACVEKYMKHIAHLHTSGYGENHSRPQLTKKDHYELVDIFRTVKRLGYDGTFSNESDNSRFETEGRTALEVIKEAYAEAIRPEYTVRSWKGARPVIPESCKIFENCSIYGNVVFGENCVVMPGTVIRAEMGKVVIGDNTNIQDMCCIHTDTYENADVIIGSNVTIGHRALLHACTIEDNSMIGMGAIILNGARVGKGAMVSAGALVTQNAVIDDGMLAVGVPAKVRREVKESEIKEMAETIAEYAETGAEYIK